MRVGVMGTGHVGLVQCGILAAAGHVVIGFDSDDEKIFRLKNGTSPFFEHGLDALIEQEMSEGRLSFTSDPAEAIGGAEVVFMCVGTPARPDGEANLSAIERAARAVAKHATERMVVVEKSTVPAGTAARVKRALAHERPDLIGHLEVASNPEFLREGKAVADALEPDRILVGAESDWALETMRKLYKPFLDQGCLLIETDIQTAELAKHACNAFLAMKISYANALARVCEKSGADILAVVQVMAADSRIGGAFLNAGLGYGGYCLPKDVQAFERLAARLGYEFPLLREVARINEEAVRSTLERIRDAVWNLDDKKIALLGLSFKPGTDDVRLSPALDLARQLLDEGARVVGYDPQAEANAKAELPEIETAVDAYEAADQAHCLVVCTEWDEFRALDLDKLKEAMDYPIVVDARNIFDPKEMLAAGFVYYPTGRSSVG